MVTSIYGGEQAIKDRTKNQIISDVFRSHVAPQDFVGTVLGGQSAGVNNSENLGANIIGGIIGAPLLFGLGGASPHSYYPCIIGCGDERSTPKKDFYYNPSAVDGTNQSPLTDDYTNRLPHVNQGLLPQSTQLQQNTPQTQLDTTGGK